VRVDAGSYIIYEGDMGRKFYIVVEGLLVAKNNTEETFYQYYKEGDYFGELALINRRPRQLSVQAVTKCRLVTLTSEVFLSVINREKANVEIRNKYRDAKPITNVRKKKTREEA
jgi:CRP-like cAMP-binding protein